MTDSANIKNECLRIEEDTIHSGKGHYNASFIWSCVRYVIGIPLTVFAAWTGVDVFNNDSNIAAYLALITTTLAALQTFLGAAEKSSQHKNSAGEYLALRNKTRLFREVQIDRLDSDDAIKGLLDFAQRRDQLNSVSLAIPFVAFFLARRGINKGESYYQIDTGEGK